MNIYKSLFRPILFSLEAEKAHNLVLNTGKIIQKSSWMTGLVEEYFKYENSKLNCDYLGLHFKNPIGLAAGFDKNAEIVSFLKCLGFGFVEVGSVSANPCLGNSHPRMFRLVDDGAVINRMGLNNIGAGDVFCNYLFNGLDYNNYNVGFNIVKTNDISIVNQKAVDDILYSYNKLQKLSSYVVLNISCPNTFEGKTFENKESLQNLLSQIIPNKKKPLLLKISPDLRMKNIEEIVQLGNEYNIDGYVATNTTLDRYGLNASFDCLEKIGKGGLSGLPLHTRSNNIISTLYNLTSGKKIIIGVGGINSAEAAYTKIKAGASLVQLYTGLVYEGPGLIKKINQGLIEFLNKDGFKNIVQAVGVDVK